MSKLSPYSKFSYACRQCGQCCIGKVIQVNPYEVARLARNVGQDASAFRAAFTDDGVTLRRQESGACVFLGESGCTVHADRPLVCRLFPLGRQVAASGEAQFTQIEWTPPPNGAVGDAGCVRDFVEQQGAEPFMQAADAYFAWYCRALDSQPEASRPSPPADLMDLDATVDGHCAGAGTTPPTSLDARLQLHLDILEQQLK